MEKFKVPTARPRKRKSASTIAAAAASARKQKKERVIAEILSSEDAYLDQLNSLIKYFVDPLATSSQLVTETELKILFGEVNAIRLVNQILCDHLKSEQVILAFASLSPYLKLYSSYARNYPSSQALLMKLRKRRGFDQFIRDQEEKPGCRGLKLPALLITPIQRIPRYKLLLEQLLEHCESQEEREQVRVILDSVAKTAELIDDSVQAHENTLKIISIQDSLDSAAPKLLVPGRRFVKEGELYKLKCKGEELLLRSNSFATINEWSEALEVTSRQAQEDRESLRKESSRRGPMHRRDLLQAVARRTSSLTQKLKQRRQSYHFSPPSDSDDHRSSFLGDIAEEGGAMMKIDGGDQSAGSSSKNPFPASHRYKKNPSPGASMSPSGKTLSSPRSPVKVTGIRFRGNQSNLWLKSPNRKDKYKTVPSIQQQQQQQQQSKLTSTNNNNQNDENSKSGPSSNASTSSWKSWVLKRVFPSSSAAAAGGCNKNQKNSGAKEDSSLLFTSSACKRPRPSEEPRSNILFSANDPGTNSRETEIPFTDTPRSSVQSAPLPESARDYNRLSSTVTAAGNNSSKPWWADYETASSCTTAEKSRPASCTIS